MKSMVKRGFLMILLVSTAFALCSCGGSGGSSKRYGAGGYEMPNSSDESIVDYIQRVDPDLWNSMESNWGK
ncbi:MAG: hypothetical protein IJZ74_00515 [Clostridia bacterium]|nr:hypothetical protein [Clostridia bacterium]